MAQHLAWTTSDGGQAILQTRRERWLYLTCKRLLDISIAVILLIALSPLMLMLAVLIVLETPGPAIFRQDRVGLRRREQGVGGSWALETFVFLKFRTMYHDADSDIHRAFVEAFIRDDQQAMDELQAGSAQARKLTNDDRITSLGRFLRKTSLDELPQLWNVVKGDMSLVGPRPDVPYSVEQYEPWHRERLAAKPGLTCLWQIRGRSRVSFEDWVRMDSEYIQNQSLWLDLKILALTVPAVLCGRGAE